MWLTNRFFLFGLGNVIDAETSLSRISSIDLFESEASDGCKFYESFARYWFSNSDEIRIFYNTVLQHMLLRANESSNISFNGCSAES